MLWVSIQVNDARLQRGPPVPSAITSAFGLRAVAFDGAVMADKVYFRSMGAIVSRANV